jgi:glycosyltransferase involved in cell wall biosynthesis
MRIAIIGTRGIPANYGGFETSVEETAYRLVDRGHDVYVYCRTNIARKKGAAEYRGVKRIELPSIRSKHLDTPIHTTLSILHLLFSRLKPDIVQMYGVGNSLWLLPLRIMRLNSVSVVDGLDWQRKKWGKIARFLLRISERFAVWWSDEYVVDSHAVIEYYLSRYRKQPIYITYGANVPEFSVPENLLTEFDLRSREYVLFVGRLVPEKRVDHLISAFEKVKTDKELVIIGDNIHNQDYVNQLKRTSDARIRLLGFVYGEAYRQITSHAYIFVQPSELEGTSPALLGAMGFGNCVLVSDIPENCETIGDAGIAFKRSDPQDLTKKLQELIDNPEIVQEYRGRAIRRVKENYSWDVVTDKYEELFFSLLSG